MGLDIELYRVLTKGEVTKLKNKYGVTDIVNPERDDCGELDKIYFIKLEHLVNCDTNLETLEKFKHCLNEKEFTYYNVQAMILKSGVKTKYADLSDYYISGFLPSEKGEDYTKYEISHMKDENEEINLHFTYDEIEIFNHKDTKLGFYIKDVEYVQRKGININSEVTGKVYNENNLYRLFISTKKQLKKLNEQNRYEDSVLKNNFKIPKNHLLYLNW